MSASTYTLEDLRFLHWQLWTLNKVLVLQGSVIHLFKQQNPLTYVPNPKQQGIFNVFEVLRGGGQTDAKENGCLCLIYTIILTLSTGILSYPELSSSVWLLRYVYLGGWPTCLTLPTFKMSPPRPHPEQTTFHPTHFIPWTLSHLPTLPIGFVLCNPSQSQLDPHPGSYPGNPAVSSWRMSPGTSFWVCKRSDWGRAAEPQRISFNTKASFIVLLVDVSHFLKEHG